MKKDFDPSEWLEKKDQVASAPESSQFSEGSYPIRPISPIRPITTLEDEIEQLVCSIESSCTDIAPDYASWRDLGFALADALGESGRSYFHRLSRFYSAYDEREADKQFSACLRSHGSGITINTLFHLAKQSGINPVRNTVSTYHEKKKIKFPIFPKFPTWGNWGNRGNRGNWGNRVIPVLRFLRPYAHFFAKHLQPLARFSNTNHQ